MNIKQDRTGVRTAQDLERKYKLSMEKEAKETKGQLFKLERTLEDFVNSTISSLKEIKEGAVTTWYYNGEPLESTEPTKNWSPDEKEIHIGDLYYDKDTGYSYIYEKVNDIYIWSLIQDKDIQNALAIAGAAKDTADNKRRVFLDTPIPPYENGDLWLNNKKIYVCQISKEEQQIYEDGDFIIATDYTDDTYAKKVGDELTVVKGTVTKIKESNDKIEQQVEETIRILNAKNTIQGNPIYIEDAGEYSSDDFKIEGECYQKTTNGYQLLDFSKLTSPAETNFSFFNDELTVNSSVAYSFCQIDITNLIKSNASKSIHFNFDNISGNRYGVPVQISIVKDGIRSYYSLVTSNLERRAYTIPSDTTNITSVFIQFESNNTSVVQNSNMVIVKPILSFMENPIYESYSGEESSPNPNYQQEIETVKGITNLLNVEEWYERKYSYGLPISLSTDVVINYSTNNSVGFTINKNDYLQVISNPIQLLPKTQYTLSYERDNSNSVLSRYYIYNYNEGVYTINNWESDGNKGLNYTFTTDDNGQVVIGFGVGNNAQGTFCNVSNIMIEKGEQSHSYVSYGTYLPIKITGKNLFDLENANVTSYYGTAPSKTEKSIKGGWGYFVYPKNNFKAGTYTLSFKVKNADNPNTALLNIRSKENKIIAFVNCHTTNKITFTLDENDVLYRLHVDHGAQATTTEIYDIQIEQDIEPTEYESYKEKETLIDMNIYDEDKNIIGNHELCKIGNVYDELNIDNLGNTTIIKRIRKTILDGSENWGWATSKRSAFSISTFKDKISGINNFLCDNFSYKGSAQQEDLNYAMSFNTDNYSNYLYIQVPSNVVAIQDTNAFKQWLSNHKSTVYYPIKAEKVENIGNYKFSLFKGINHIFLEDDLKTNMTVTYFLDTELNNTFSKKSEFIMLSNLLALKLNVNDLTRAYILAKITNDGKSAIDLGADNISIKSDNFSVDQEGNMICSNAQLRNGSLILLDSGGEDAAMIIYDTQGFNTIPQLNQDISNKKINIKHAKNFMLLDLPKENSVLLETSGGFKVVLEPTVGDSKYNYLIKTVNPVADLCKIGFDELYTNRYSMNYLTLYNGVTTNSNAGTITKISNLTLTNLIILENGTSLTKFSKYSSSGFESDIYNTYSLGNKNYTEEDIKELQKIILKGSWTNEELGKYDANNDGVLSSSDLITMRKLIRLGASKDKPGHLSINTATTDDSEGTSEIIKLTSGMGEKRVSIGLTGIYSKNIDCEELNFVDSEWKDLQLASGVTEGSLCGTPQYRKLGNHVFVRGGIGFTIGNSTMTFATLPEGYRPTYLTERMNGTGGSRIARIGVRDDGTLFIDWIYNLNDKTKFTGTVRWLDIAIDFFID